MKAMQLQEGKSIDEKPLVAVETAVPSPTPHQIQIRVSVCGVCHTDLHTVEGDLMLPKLPIIPGHQVVGTVEAVGENVTLHKVGDRVGIAWMNGSCGICQFCQEGLENLCPDARFTGLHADGGYAQFMVVLESFAYPIPAAFSDAHAAPLLCAGIVGYRALRLSQIKPEGKLGLYGFGASAHLAIQVARSWDCEVCVFTRSQEHRQHALELGADWAGGAEDEPPFKLDSSVTFAPAGWIIPLALGHLRPGGTLAINAIHTSPIPEIPYQLIYGERVLRSVANFTRYDAKRFLQIADTIGIKTTVSEYALSDANEVLLTLKRSEITGAAVLWI
ncbi:MAG: zinc-binding alcohol dehydrogenase family protein [Chloroflexi bacterium]|nr:MAG: zinc-binding alcohol dehydrogenase family protein [Chloroflexota bacterium]